jgi:hypothetical protein
MTWPRGARKPRAEALDRSLTLAALNNSYRRRAAWALEVTRAPGAPAASV